VLSEMRGQTSAGIEEQVHIYIDLYKLQEIYLGYVIIINIMVQCINFKSKSSYR
jgi:hypothetical protein